MRKVHTIQTFVVHQTYVYVWNLKGPKNKKILGTSLVWGSVISSLIVFQTLQGLPPSFQIPIIDSYHIMDSLHGKPYPAFAQHFNPHSRQHYFLMGKSPKGDSLRL